MDQPINFPFISPPTSQPAVATPAPPAGLPAQQVELPAQQLIHDPHQCDCSACATWRRDVGSHGSHGSSPSYGLLSLLPANPALIHNHPLSEDERRKLIAEIGASYRGCEQPTITIQLQERNTSVSGEPQKLYGYPVVTVDDPSLKIPEDAIFFAKLTNEYARRYFEQVKAGRDAAAEAANG